MILIYYEEYKIYIIVFLIILFFFDKFNYKLILFNELIARKSWNYKYPEFQLKLWWNELIPYF